MYNDKIITQWSKRSMYWLCISIILSTATQLRLPGLVIPLGPGEIMLALWVGVYAVLLFSSNETFSFSSTTDIFRFYWLASFFLLLMGLVFATILDTRSTGWMRDTLAYLLVAILCFLLSGANVTFIQMVTKRVIIGTTLVFFFWFVASQLNVNVGIVRPYNPNGRFVGWSDNPNQTGFFMSYIPFFLLYFLNKSKKKVEKSGYIILICMSVIVGMATASDSFIASQLAGLGVLIVWMLPFPIANSTQSGLSLIIKKWMGYWIVALLLIIYIYVTASGYDPLNSLVEAARSVYSEGQQGYYRVRLWQNGLRVLWSSPIFGYGPGAHSGIVSTFQNFETHNTFIDWATNTGLIGLALYIRLLFKQGILAWRNGTPTLVAALLAMSIFSMFGHLMRHPYLWFFLVSLATFNAKNSLTSPTYSVKSSRNIDFRLVTNENQ